MENKQLIEYKESFITKVRKFFKNLFKNNKQDYGYTQEMEHTNNQTISKTNGNIFLDDLRVTNSVVNESKEIKMKKFLKEINGNEELLNKLSVNRLKELERYYEDVIKENEKKIMQANK